MLPGGTKDTSEDGQLHLLSGTASSSSSGVPHIRSFDAIVNIGTSNSAEAADINIGENETCAYGKLSGGAGVELLNFNDHSEVPTQQFFGVTSTTKSDLSKMANVSRASPIEEDVQSVKMGDLYKLVKGTMPASLLYVQQMGGFVQFVDACLRGSSQVFFVNNPLCGFVILVAIAYDSWYSLIFGVTGLVASTIMAHIVSVDVGAIQAGLYGYNGLLTGLAIALFSFGDKANPRIQMLLPAALMGGMSTIIMIAVANFTVRLFNIAPFTFPFQVASWIWMLAAQSTFQYFPLQFPMPTIALLVEDMSSALSVHNYAADKVLVGILTGVGQVYFVGNAISGAIMLLGVAISSPITAFLAVFGSSVGVIFSMAMGTPLKPLVDGLYGYNPSLTAVAVGGMFFVPSLGNLLYAALACVLTTVLSAAVAAGLAPVGMPVLTFPFTLVSWIFIIVGTSNPIVGVIPVSLAMVTYPENHRDRYNASKLISLSLVKMLGKLPFLMVRNEQDLVRIETRILPVLLCHYSSRGDLISFKRILNSASDKLKRINVPDHVGRTPLIVAAANGHLHMVKYLLSKSVDVSVKDQYDHTALDEAIHSRNAYVIDLISSRGGRLGADAQRHMMVAVEGNDIEMVALLLRAKLNPSGADMRQRTPLHLAVSLTGRLSIIQLLLVHGADLDARDGRGDSVLDYAIRARQQDVIGYITAYKNCDNDHKKMTFLRQVIEEEPYTRSRSASLEGLDTRSRSATLEGRSAERRQSAIPVMSPIPVVSASATSSNSTDSDVAVILPQLLCVAASQNETREMAFLLGVRPPDSIGEENESISLTDTDINIARTDLLQISLKGIRTVEQNGPGEQHQQMLHVNSIDYDGRSPLLIAATNGSLEACKFLLDLGAEVNCVDRWGTTPLWCAVVFGSLDVVMLLTSYGAILPENKNLRLELLQKLVKTNKLSSWKKLFIVPDFDLDIGDYDGVTAMHLAAKYEAFDSIKALRDAGANPVCEDNWGETPKLYSMKAAVHIALQRKVIVSSTFKPSKSRDNFTSQIMQM